MPPRNDDLTEEELLHLARIAFRVGSGGIEKPEWSLADYADRGWVDVVKEVVRGERSMFDQDAREAVRRELTRMRGSKALSFMDRPRYGNPDSSYYLDAVSPRTRARLRRFFETGREDE